MVLIEINSYSKDRDEIVLSNGLKDIMPYCFTNYMYKQYLVVVLVPMFISILGD